MDGGGTPGSQTEEKLDKTSSGSSWEQDWIRSVGSSFSLTDESDSDVTAFLQDQLNRFDSVLYENASTEGLVGDALEEIKLWSYFPHLRILGTKVKLLKGEGFEEDCVEEVIEEDDSDDTLKGQSSDSDEEEATVVSLRSKSSSTNCHRNRRGWYPVHTQSIPCDEMNHQARLSPIPVGLNHQLQPRVHLVENAPSAVRHGTLPPIETLEISSKVLSNRAASARIQKGTVGFLSRPTTSRPPKALSPISGRSSSFKRRTLTKTPNLNENGVKSTRSFNNPIMWRY